MFRLSSYSFFEKQKKLSFYFYRNNIQYIYEILIFDFTQYIWYLDGHLCFSVHQKFAPQEDKRSWIVWRDFGSKNPNRVQQWEWGKMTLIRIIFNYNISCVILSSRINTGMLYQHRSKLEIDILYEIRAQLFVGANNCV
jgi:hypothetical protein